MIMEEKNFKRLGSEKTFKHKCGKIIVGTLDKVDTKSAYVRLETWVTVEESLETSIEAIRRRIIANMYSVSHTYFEGLKSTIIDYQYNLTKGYDKAGKKSFISIDITLLSKDKFDWNEDFIFNCEAFGDTIFCLLGTLSDKFDMSPSKN
jgi:hypothetical protein